MKRKIVIAAVTAAVLVGGTAAAAVAFAADDGPAAGSATARVSVGDAASSAVRAVPGTVTEAELDDEDGGLVWELDVYGSDEVWHDVTVDAGNGKVLGKHTSDDNDDRDRHAPRPATVTLDQAAAAALKTSPGTVTSVELEGRSGGAVRWEVDVRGKDGRAHELNVDAKSGAVTVDRSDGGRDTHDGRDSDNGRDSDDDDD
ncbi:PepSY domain-containing protein [Streptomyces poriferorum]|uniref:PepSY domain-containing protein n=1 Tax=Streptomyces poriferorum TaxID=2798799 RepID=A0ABY9ILX2_9ACTN|nr:MULTISPECIES: PepSY domain-containing protein [unclassified Streptomyces]MDP5314793.1 PepSY domain-containing protein [Streptomyces sp. Alt4]WLQ56315.1 PepSY domain-containing protein [Streptomyces sp. Alt2]